ncbi:helix-turn-helix domain-containing protein [Amycolatopsis pigmentata]|uniref:Helix-turn-helix domain-containing protein n=1 Tax=Amycolatopsis pigmentata TaxID=450801 RepID=A0ABW5G6J8_9PSEU
MGVIKKAANAGPLADLVKSLRTERKLVQRDFCELVDIDQGTWAKYERGTRTPSVPTIERVLAKLGISGDRREEILATARGADAPRWLATTLPEQRAQQAALIRAERKAKSIRQVAPELIPGPLQTTPYARAIFERAGLDEDEIEIRVTTRNGRRDVITRPDGAQFSVILGPAALRQQIGGLKTLIGQLKHLRELSDWPNIDIRAWDYTADWHPGLEGFFALIESDEESPLVYLETRRSGLFFYDAEDVKSYRDAFNRMVGDDPREAVAMTPARTQQAITDLIKELET